MSFGVVSRLSNLDCAALSRTVTVDNASCTVGSDTGLPIISLRILAPLAIPIWSSVCLVITSPVCLALRVSACFSAVNKSPCGSVSVSLAFCSAWLACRSVLAATTLSLGLSPTTDFFSARSIAPCCSFKVARVAFSVSSSFFA